MSSEPKLGAGDVEILIANRTETLRPSLKACRAIAKEHGGVLSVIERVNRLDPEAITGVVALGLDKKIEEIEEAVWEAGITTLAAPVARFVENIWNGGRPLASGGSESTANPQPIPSASSTTTTK